MTPYLKRGNLILSMKVKKGFSLVELLVVIGIMGSLVTILLPNFLDARLRGKDAKRKLDIEQMRSALEMYRSLSGAYPANGSFLNTNCTIDSPFTYTDPVSGTVTTLMASIPKDPGCNKYRYTDNSTTSDYTICAYLESSTTATSAAGLNCNQSGTAVPCNYCLGSQGAK